YFNGSYIAALQVVFPQLQLNPLEFRLDWSTREKAIESIRIVLAREAPHLLERYANLSTQAEVAGLQNDVYRITNGHFQIWGLGSVNQQNVVPYFNGSYIEALQAVFPQLQLNPLGFQLDWSSREKAIESI